MPKRRLGVALLLPPPLDHEVDALRRACDDGSLGRIPAHLTLVPPVNVRDDRLEDAVHVLRAAAGATRPFTVELGPPATFLPDSPTLYLAVSGPGFAALGDLRDRVFREPLERPLTWPFVPHVTLADEMATERIETALTAMAGYRASVTFERVHVLEEGPGRVWTPLADFAFAAPAVVGRGGVELELTVSDQLDPEGREFADREWAVWDTAEYGAPWNEEPFAIAARLDGEIVGIARGWTVGGRAHLGDLLVGAAHRDLGVGSRLLAAFESLAAERGCHRLVLRTIAGTPAVDFYLRRGWVEEARFSDWAFGREAVQLRRDL
jgi:2'-5' RNA ligase/GNAT superfamily N-acetyltransferase